MFSIVGKRDWLLTIVIMTLAYDQQIKKQTAPYTFLNNIVHVSMDSRVSDKYSLPQLPLLGKPNGRKIAICLQSDMKP